MEGYPLVRPANKIKNTTTNMKNIGYRVMKKLLIFPDTDLSLVLMEQLREHLVISYTADYCNYCLRI